MKDPSVGMRRASNGGKCRERGKTQVVMCEGNSSDTFDE
jgi:hypothetical protein